MGTFSLITLVLGIAEPLLASSGVIPANYQPLAQGVLSAITALKEELTGANGKLTVTAITLMQAVSSGLQALATAGALPANVAGIAEALTSATAAGVTEYQQTLASGTVDPSTLQPAAPVA